MLSVKKKVILLSSLGVIPFYSDILIIYLINFYNIKLFPNIDLLSFFYGSLISSFLCGMHWINLINTKKKFLSIPMIPVILLWISFFLEKIFFQLTVILSLLWCLNVDISILKNENNLWFKKMRIIITIIAILPLIYNLFINRISYL
ncbi:MAG: hypothetical protein CMM92_02195 [Rickettsiales bacterium]|nr:hypothetical protein [Rickettsiales bacterium]RPG15012.1 MAG: DUF3429 family protein [Pelagibacteraceae bacterium TMED195]|tara:strand:- start:185 stop:625 length:441 start_codon:yes stop_codon:yes gene_type:complete